MHIDILFDSVLLVAIAFQCRANLNTYHFNAFLRSLVILVGFLMLEKTGLLNLDSLDLGIPFPNTVLFCSIKAIWLAEIFRIRQAASSPGSVHKLGPGLHFVRSVTKDERRIIQDAFNSVQKWFQKTNQENAEKDDLRTVWSNLYINQEWKEEVPESVRKELMPMAMSMIKDTNIYPNPYLLSFSFVYGPAGNRNPQKFHIDYANSIVNLCIPITKSTIANATQTIENVTLEADAFDDAACVKKPLADELWSAENGKPVRAVQTVFPQWTLSQLNPRTIHRGVTNNAPDAKDRCVFFICFNDKWIDVGEYTNKPFMTCSDYCAKDCKLHYRPSKKITTTPESKMTSH